MTPTAEPRGLSLGARLFLAFGLVLALAVGGAMAATYWLIGEVADRSVERSLSNSQSVQAYFRELRARQLELVAELIAADPYFGGYVAEAVDAADRELAVRSITDLLLQERAEFDLALAMVLDTEGRVLARSDRPQALGRSLDDQPLVARARIDLVPAIGLWRIGDEVYQAAVTPIVQGRSVTGFLVAGLALDDALANDVKRVSGADVAYLAGGDPPVLLSTTLDVPSADRLVARLDDPSVAADAGAARSDSRSVALGEDRWVLRVSPLTGPDGEALGTAVALTSLDRALAPYRDIPMLVLITGLVAVGAALLLSYLLSQRILQPVRSLTEAAEAAVGGDYRHQVANRRGDEIGRLSRSFDSLLSSLREKRDMEDYMADVSRHVDQAAGGRGDRSFGPREGPATDRTQALDDETLPELIDDTAPGERERRPLGSRYSLMAELGAGAMGVVYKAHDRRLDEIVAIKMIKPGSVDDESLARLRDELKTARRITHPNVLRTYDFGEIDGQAYISMEYINGLTLRTLLKQKGRLPYGAALRVARQICAGLAAVHEVGVVHRDVKPGNVMIEHRGNAKLMDFGISMSARAVDRDSDGVVVGTPHYLAPEQVEGNPADDRSDIFALGVLLEQLFTGGMPFSGKTSKAIAAARILRPPEPPSKFWPDIPGELEAIILRCLARQPDDRYQAVTDLLEQLESLRG